MQGGGNGPHEERPKDPFAELKQAILKELEPLLIPILDFLIKIIKFLRRLVNRQGTA